MCGVYGCCSSRYRRGINGGVCRMSENDQKECNRHACHHQTSSEHCLSEGVEIEGKLLGTWPLAQFELCSGTEASIFLPLHGSALDGFLRRRQRQRTQHADNLQHRKINVCSLVPADKHSLPYRPACRSARARFRAMVEAAELRTSDRLTAGCGEHLICGFQQRPGVGFMYFVACVWRLAGLLGTFSATLEVTAGSAQHRHDDCIGCHGVSIPCRPGNKKSETLPRYNVSSGILVEQRVLAPHQSD